MSYTFSPFAKFPTSVKEKINSEMWNFNQSNLAILETSHRSPVFAKVNDDTILSLREYLNIPDNYKILLMQGGEQLAQGSFPFNLLNTTKKCIYLVTGPRSEFASTQAKLHPDVTVTTLTVQEFSSRDIEGSAYTYICVQDRQTGHFFNQPVLLPKQISVLDCTSILGLYPINIQNHGIVFGSVQFSLGLPGVTIVIVRQDLIGKEMKQCPNMMSYATMNEKKSIYNTPNCFAVYTLGEHVKWLIQQGGLKEIWSAIKKKVEYLKEKVENSGGKVKLEREQLKSCLIFTLEWNGEGKEEIGKRLEEKRLLKLENQKIQINIQNSTEFEHIDALFEQLSRAN